MRVTRETTISWIRRRMRRRRRRRRRRRKRRRRRRKPNKKFLATDRAPHTQQHPIGEKWQEFLIMRFEIKSKGQRLI